MISIKKLYLRKKSCSYIGPNYIVSNDLKNLKNSPPQTQQLCLPSYTKTTPISRGGHQVKAVFKTECQMIKYITRNPRNNTGLFYNNKWYTGKLLEKTNPRNTAREIFFLIIRLKAQRF